MKLFVANCTKQVHDFVYRLPEKGTRLQRIEIGSQIQVAGDLSQPEIDAIVDHHARYGMRSVADVKKMKTEFVGLCYSVDKPVSRENMEIALQRNDDVLIDRGQQLRKQAAVATSAAIMQDGNQQNLKGFETSITEVRKDGGEPEVQETVRVDPNAAAPETVDKGNAAKAKMKSK